MFDPYSPKHMMERGHGGGKIRARRSSMIKECMNLKKEIMTISQVNLELIGYHDYCCFGSWFVLLESSSKNSLSCRLMHKSSLAKSLIIIELITRDKWCLYTLSLTSRIMMCIYNVCLLLFNLYKAIKLRLKWGKRDPATYFTSAWNWNWI